MKNCPYCAEEIQDEAIKCKHCGEFLNGSGPPRIPANNLPLYFKTSFIVIMGLSIPPLALPSVWWHPRLTLVWKIAITVVILALTWATVESFIVAFKMFDEVGKMLKSI